MVSEPKRELIVVGLNVTPIVQLDPAGRLVPQVFDATAKSPLVTTLVIFSAASPRFSRVTNCAGLVKPMPRLGKVRLGGATYATGNAKPDSFATKASVVPCNASFGAGSGFAVGKFVEVTLPAT
jgi:hypothetical protein